jgi:2,4-dienoyl-CoA reductase-like NADH-dependent reductase (Old Yellow Enzyme family)
MAVLALSTPLALLDGISRIETVQRAMEEGSEFVAMGRALLCEPDLLRRWQDGAPAPTVRSAPGVARGSS